VTGRRLEHPQLAQRNILHGHRRTPSSIRNSLSKGSEELTIPYV
jgi:hypothetical protein